MIALLAVTFQLASAAVAPAGATAAVSPAPAGPLVVKDATRRREVPLVATPDGPVLRADALRPIVPLTVSHLTADRWLLIVNGTAVEVRPGVRYARMDSAQYQLAAAPVARGRDLYVPLQLVAEILPRVATNLIWDPQRFELRAFSAVRTFARREEARAAAVERVLPRDGDARAGSGLRSGPPPEEALRTVARSAEPSGEAPLPSALRSRHLVVVDAGHGGPDAGMRGPLTGGPQVAEKNITLSVARRVGAALGRRGVSVKYTRTTDTLIALGDRGRIANEAHADLFVSIHVNAANPGWSNPGSARGFETYFLAEARTEDARRVERMENEVVRFEANAHTRAGDPLDFIIKDMAQNEHLRESSDLAELIQRRLGDVHPGPSRGVKQAGFRVLVTAFMPAVLVEIGFGTNAQEASYLTDPERMDALSAAVADGVVEYLKRYERRVTMAGSAAGGGLAPR